jgi:hypothetical protein
MEDINVDTLLLLCCPLMIKSKLTQRAPDGSGSARFFGFFLSFGTFPFPSLFLPSRR